jgi:putative spermidine/putrescine transport system ATP-binding protein
MKNSELRINQVTKRFGDVKALDNLDLTIKSGEMVALLGPSGCGKTTALRIVAGLETLEKGSIKIGNSDITNLPAHQRNMGMVFQAYSLFPNLTVLENVSFGLKMRKVSRDIQIRKSLDLLEMIGLPDHKDRYPHQLSGGQQQRVALARALAIEPSVLLLDEPLSALDAQVRTTLREEIRRLQLSLGITTLFVTHDQEEAMSISDRVGVMRNGKLEQIGDPADLYNKPKTTFVATFVGSANRIPAKITEKGNVKVLGQKIPLSHFSANFEDGKSVVALIRPESLHLVSENDPESSRGNVVFKSFLGPLTKISVQLPDQPLMHLNISSKEAKRIEIGDAINLKIIADELMAENV